MKKKIILLILLLTLVTGCKSTPKIQNGKESVATTENGAISVDELYNEMKEDYALSKLIDMVDRKILSEKYKSDDVEKEYIEEALNEARIMYENYYKLQYTTFETYIGQIYGARDENDLKKIFSLASKKKRAIEDYAKKQVTEKEIKEYYEKKYIGDMEASHILIRVDSTTNASEADKKKAEEAALKQANEIIKKLNKGEKFEDLAKKYSKDSSANNGGKLGRFPHKKMVSEFEDATYKLKEGEYTKTPVKTQFGYHIILKIKQHEKEDIKKVENILREFIAKDNMAKDNLYSQKALVEIRKENKMSIEDSKLKEQYDNYIFNLNKKKN